MSVRNIRKIVHENHDYAKSPGVRKTGDAPPKRCGPVVRSLVSRPFKTWERTLTLHGHLDILICEMGSMSFGVLSGKK